MAAEKLVAAENRNSILKAMMSSTNSSWFGEELLMIVDRALYGMIKLMSSVAKGMLIGPLKLFKVARHRLRLLAC